jgi:hypothetical protein
MLTPLAYLLRRVLLYAGFLFLIATFFFSPYSLKLFVYRELANRAFARHSDDRRRVDVLGMPFVAYLVSEGARGGAFG